jgi:hypothetical protein
LKKGERMRPDFRDALETQAIVDAVLQSASAEKWVECGAFMCLTTETQRTQRKAP